MPSLNDPGPSIDMKLIILLIVALNGVAAVGKPAIPKSTELQQVQSSDVWLSSAEYATVVDFLVEMSLLPSEARKDWVLAQPSSTLILVDAYFFGDVVGGDRAVAETTVVARDQIREFLRKSLWGDGVKPEMAYADRIISEMARLLTLHVEKGELSDRLAVNMGAGFSILVPFQSPEAASRNYSQLTRLTNQTASRELRHHIFDLLLAFPEKKLSIYRKFIDDQDLELAYRSARGLAESGSHDAAVKYVHYSWDLYSTRVGRPGPLGTRNYEPPVNALTDVFDGAPSLVSREAQLAWLVDHPSEP